MQVTLQLTHEEFKTLQATPGFKAILGEDESRTDVVPDECGTTTTYGLPTAATATITKLQLKTYARVYIGVKVLAWLSEAPDRQRSSPKIYAIKNFREWSGRTDERHHFINAGLMRAADSSLGLADSKLFVEQVQELYGTLEVRVAAGEEL